MAAKGESKMETIARLWQFARLKDLTQASIRHLKFIGVFNWKEKLSQLSS
jgi:hypothetical protein